jgi:hypothetical protein
VDVSCNAGDRALSGGYDLQDEFLQLLGSYPEGVTGWRSDGLNISLFDDKRLRTYVVCADLTP